MLCVIFVLSEGLLHCCIREKTWRQAVTGIYNTSYQTTNCQDLTYSLPPFEADRDSIISFVWSKDGQYSFLVSNCLLGFTISLLPFTISILLVVLPCDKRRQLPYMFIIIDCPWKMRVRLVWCKMVGVGIFILDQCGEVSLMTWGNMKTCIYIAWK